MHFVLVTKNRRGVLDDDMLRYCERVTRKACDDFETDPREFNGETDHVHLLVFYPPKVAVSALANSKGRVGPDAARTVHTGQANRARMNGHSWSPSYLAASCGGAPLSTIRQYIEQQQRPA